MDSPEPPPSHAYFLASMKSYIWSASTTANSRYSRDSALAKGETLVSTRRTASMSAVLQAASMAAKAKLARGFDFDTAASIHAIKSRSKTARSPENGALVQ